MGLAWLQVAASEGLVQSGYSFLPPNPLGDNPDSKSPDWKTFTRQALVQKAWADSSVKLKVTGYHIPTLSSHPAKQRLNQGVAFTSFPAPGLIYTLLRRDPSTLALNTAGDLTFI